MFQVMQMSPKHQLEGLEKYIRQNLTKEHRKENLQRRQDRGLNEEFMSPASSN